MIYKKWFEEVGHTYYEDIMEWATNAPRGIALVDFMDLAEFAHEACFDIYMSEQPDLFYIDREGFDDTY